MSELIQNSDALRFPFPEFSLAGPLTPDARKAPIEPSLQLLDGLHARWAALLKNLNAADFARNFRHPEHGPRSLDWLLVLYAWHGPHHVAHITALREKMRW